MKMKCIHHNLLPMWTFVDPYMTFPDFLKALQQNNKFCPIAAQQDGATRYSLGGEKNDNNNNVNDQCAGLPGWWIVNLPLAGQLQQFANEPSTKGPTTPSSCKQIHEF